MRFVQSPYYPSSLTLRRSKRNAACFVLCIVATTGAGAFTVTVAIRKGRIATSLMQQPLADTSTDRRIIKSVESEIITFAGHDNSYAVSQTLRVADACRKSGLDKLGITKPTTIYRNLSYRELYEREVAKKEGVFVKTGMYSGSSSRFE